MEQLENAMLQPRIEHKVDWDEYEDYLEHLYEEDDRRYEDGDD